MRTSRAFRALAVLALAASLGLAGCADDDPQADDPNADETSASASEEPTEPTDEPTDSSSAPADTVAAPVYFAGETPIGTRLYREFRQVEADNPLEEAAALMVAGDALDPDYGTLFPPGDITSIVNEGGLIVVEVPHHDWQDRAANMSGRTAKLAAQQLVYTLQGAAGERLPVVVTHDGESTTLFGIDTADGLTSAKPLSVLAFMNVTTPEEGTTVTDVFTATGVGSSFEATILWEVRDGSGNAVKDGFTTADGWIGKLWPWEAEVDVTDLQPGTYTFAAITDDPSGGEGAGPTEDTKTIIVE